MSFFCPYLPAQGLQCFTDRYHRSCRKIPEPRSISNRSALALRELAGGVAVVTVGKDDALTGFTAASVSSLSAQPPRLIVCVDRSSASWLSLQQNAYFGVNLLRNNEHALASWKRWSRGIGSICRRAMDDVGDGRPDPEGRLGLARLRGRGAAYPSRPQHCHRPRARGSRLSRCLAARLLEGNYRTFEQAVVPPDRPSTGRIASQRT